MEKLIRTVGRFTRTKFACCLPGEIITTVRINIKKINMTGTAMSPIYPVIDLLTLTIGLEHLM